MTDANLPEPPELPRGIALAWGVAANPQRGPKREMSVERIVETAIELADAEGLGAVSMAAVAARLGFTPMSLYRYVSAKDDLLLLMQEEAIGPPPEEFREQDGWRAQLRLLFEAQARVYLEHPWLVALPISGAPVTPNSSAWLDASLESLAATPLEETERVAVALGITGQARWFGIVVAGYASRAREAGASADEVSAQEAVLFDRVVTAEEVPALRRAIDAGVFTADDDPFRFAVERLLDGVESFVEARSRGEERPTPDAPLDADLDLAGEKKVREASRAVREAEKALRAARKAERQVLREARERARRS